MGEALKKGGSQILSAVLLLATLAQCNFLSEAEIERRIKAALPEVGNVDIVYLRSNGICVYAIAAIAPSGAFLERAQKRNEHVKDTETLGENWWEVASIADFPDGHLATLFEGVPAPDLGSVFGFAKDCAPDDETFWRDIRDTAGYFSVYPGADEAIFVTGDKFDRVVYLAGG